MPRPGMMGMGHPGGMGMMPMGVPPPGPPGSAPGSNDLDSLLTRKSTRDRLKTEK